MLEADECPLSSSSQSSSDTAKNEHETVNAARVDKDRKENEERGATISLNGTDMAAEREAQNPNAAILLLQTMKTSTKEEGWIEAIVAIFPLDYTNL